MNMQIMVLGFDDFLPQSRRLAEELSLPFERVIIHHFPDGESKVTIPTILPETIIICRSLDQPNNKLIELILCAQTARSQGVKRLILVAPYLCYMRQDIAFLPGEAISQKIIGQMLADYYDELITIDPHLHRISHLEQAVPAKKAIALRSAKPVNEFLQAQFKTPIIIGPDEESEQWVSAIAAPNSWDYQIATKTRLGDKKVKVALDDYDYQQQNIVIVDDIASTGHTLLKTVEKLQTHQPASISIVVTHAFFVDDALGQLKQAGVNQIWSSDSVSHSTNAFSVIPHIAQSLAEQLVG